MVVPRIVLTKWNRACPLWFRDQNGKLCTFLTTVGDVIEKRRVSINDVEVTEYRIRDYDDEERIERQTW